MKKALVLLVSFLTITSSAHALQALPSDDIPDTGNSLYCPQLSQTLKRGMRDASTYPTGQVSELQNFLADYFELNEQDIISGFFGRNTQRYVMNFQQKYGLPAYGIAGALTRMKIAEVCTSQTVQPTTCNNYPKPTCGPNQKLVEEWNDYRGCPTVARCVDISTSCLTEYPKPVCQNYEQLLSEKEEQVLSNGQRCYPIRHRCVSKTNGDHRVSISTPRPNYTLNETIPVTVKATTSGEAATASAGYKVLVTDISRRYVNFNPGYNSATGYWEGNFNAPYPTTELPIQAELYCSNRALPCGKYVKATEDEVLAKGDIKLVIGTRPSVTLTADKYTVSAGEAVSVRWSATNATRCWMQHGPVGGTHTEIAPLPLSGIKQFNPYVRYVVRLGCAYEDGSGKDGLQDTKEVTIDVQGQSSNQIAVTAPNGGEQWQLGSTNSITWSPYSYNPDINPSRDVKAYLEQKDAYGNFVTVGRITDSGKASIHWNGYLEDDTAQGYVNHRMAKPGNGYFIRVVNKVTGASDRSDSPFSIMPQGSIKVSVEMISYPPGSRVVYDPQFYEESRNVVEITDQKLLNSYGNYTVSWKSTVATGTCSLIYPGRTTAATGNTLDKIDNLPTSGTQAVSLFHDGRQPFFSVSVHCDHAAAGSVQGSSIGHVYIKPMFNALSITEPNGGVVNADQESAIKWTSAGIAQNSIALYKNDQWYKWILRDYPGGNSGTSWTPRNYITDADIASGSIWKIYITGQRSDGLGYLDDKSDTPFSFVPTINEKKLVMTQPSAGAEFKLGSLVPIQWTLGGFVNDNYTQIKIRLQSYNPNGQYDDVAELGMLNAFALGYPQTITAETKGCFSLGSAYCNKTVGAYISEGKNKFIITGEIYNNGVFAGVREFSAPFTLTTSETTFSATGPNIAPTWVAKNFTHYNGKRYCFGGQYVAQSPKYPGAWLGVDSCNDATDDQYKLYMSDSENGTYYQIADTAGHGQDQCELVNPNFTIPNEDDIKSGGCTTCDVQNMSDPQDEPVFVRANFGQPFKLQKSVVWADLTSQIYKCGVNIPNVTTSSVSAGSSAGGVSGTTINPYDLLWSFSPLRIFGN